MADAAYEVLAACVAAMKASPAVTALAGVRVYDRAPEGANAPTSPYVSCGPSMANRVDVTCISAKEIYIQIDAWSWGVGLAYSRTEACNLADAIELAIHHKPLVLPTNRLVSIDHRNTLIMLDADGATHHAVINFVAYTESI